MVLKCEHKLKSELKINRKRDAPSESCSVVDNGFMRQLRKNIIIKHNKLKTTYTKYTGLAPV